MRLERQPKRYEGPNGVLKLTVVEGMYLPLLRTFVRAWHGGAQYDTRLSENALEDAEWGSSFKIPVQVPPPLPPCPALQGRAPCPRGGAPVARLTRCGWRRQDRGEPLCLQLMVQIREYGKKEDMLVADLHLGLDETALPAAVEGGVPSVNDSWHPFVDVEKDPSKPKRREMVRTHSARAAQPAEPTVDCGSGDQERDPHVQQTVVTRITLLITVRLVWHCGDHTAKLESASGGRFLKLCCFGCGLLGSFLFFGGGEASLSQGVCRAGWSSRRRAAWVRCACPCRSTPSRLRAHVTRRVPRASSTRPRATCSCVPI